MCTFGCQSVSVCQVFFLFLLVDLEVVGVFDLFLFFFVVGVGIGIGIGIGDNGMMRMRPRAPPAARTRSSSSPTSAGTHFTQFIATSASGEVWNSALCLGVPFPSIEDDEGRESCTSGSVASAPRSDKLHLATSSGTSGSSSFHSNLPDLSRFILRSETSTTSMSPVDFAYTSRRPRASRPGQDPRQTL